MMAYLELSILGVVQIVLGGKPVTGFKYSRTPVLLLYLAVEADHAHRRDVLVDLLWPDVPLPAALVNLRQILADVRRVIGDRQAAQPFLRVTRETIQFNAASDYELDIAAFTKLLDACAAHPHRRLETCQTCAQRLRRAVDLYRGDFLATAHARFSLPDSVTFDEWVLRHRENTRQRTLEALVLLTGICEQRGDYDHAQRLTRRQLEIDPWSEEAHRQLMRLLWQQGQRSAALAQYERYRHILMDELGVTPAPETVALCERILTADQSVPSTEKRRTATELYSDHFPTQLTSFIGRTQELAQLASRLEDPSCRLLTIVGSGGIGKTRLAVATAERQAVTFADGAFFVSCASVQSVEFLVPALASGIHFPFEGPENPKIQLLSYLRNREMLLVMDNLEHLLVDSEDLILFLTELLQQARAVTVLATSRERLYCPGEWVIDVDGLPMPEADQTGDVENYDAVRLFVASAQRLHTGFLLTTQNQADVVSICRLVAGMPLGIELVAGWVRALSCADIAREIRRGLDVLSTTRRDMPERHRNLRAVFDRSWIALMAEEQRVLRRLSIFRGGFDRDAAERVAGATLPVLAALMTNRCCVQQWPDATTPMS